MRYLKWFFQRSFFWMIGCLVIAVLIALPYNFDGNKIWINLSGWFAFATLFFFFVLVFFNKKLNS